LPTVPVLRRARPAPTGVKRRRSIKCGDVIACAFFNQMGRDLDSTGG